MRDFEISDYADAIMAVLVIPGLAFWLCLTAWACLWMTQKSILIIQNITSLLN
jgi:hypothetical protein